MRSIFIAVLCICFIGCKPVDEVDKAPAIDPNKKEIVFVTHNGPSTYYLNNDNQPAGIEYDLASLFVKTYFPDHEVRFLLVNSISDVIPSLLKGKAHIAAANLSVTHLRQHLVIFSTPYQETQQQLIFNNEVNKKPKDISDIFDKKISVPEGTSYEEHLAALQKKHSLLKWHSAKRTNTESLLEEVADGLLDFTVADSHLAALMQNYHPNLDVAMPIGTADKIAWAMSKNSDPQLIAKINTFFSKIKEDGTLRNLLDRYYGHNKRLNSLDVTTFLKRTNSLLPKYIHLFKQAQDITGIDWRLLAAVSYRESHWDTYNTSPTNVRGLMMLTESTADLMGVTDRLDPKQSIPAGAKYLLKLIDTVPERIPEPDRTYMALASYNIGYAHVEDARVLAKRLGLNPDSWADVKKTLVLLKNPEYYTTLKYGYASGGAPVIFVESVRSYQRILEKHQPSHNPELDKFRIARN
ncbi:membrane-bound lytic murein transglycosylase MltF [Methylotenera sp.]|uniref:membrane-bound lytic murein transglycosylase MltF n=1 Tax=Methylotenera sp. TaxID=2051956 RepID=UPI0027346C50|nr:membrane-bound lytic murein transglycosylase MltF [Methylotenera sp.]MDP3210499.1 membrane-bound lytic murein transglycosylase MltF [Methylotenera sp.]MDP3776843.1 membrane-bound lytic murein transglycosylase MltF [Methylotenera sp.]